jgi:hypothetical protein
MFVNDNKDEGKICRFIFIFNRNNECRTCLIAYSFDLDTKKLENSEYIADITSGRMTFASLEEESLITDIIKYNNPSISFFIPKDL